MDAVAVELSIRSEYFWSWTFCFTLSVRRTTLCLLYTKRRSALRTVSLLQTSLKDWNLCPKIRLPLSWRFTSVPRVTSTYSLVAWSTYPPITSQHTERSASGRTCPTKTPSTISKYTSPFQRCNYFCSLNFVHSTSEWKSHILKAFRLWSSASWYHADSWVGSTAYVFHLIPWRRGAKCGTNCSWTKTCGRNTLDAKY